MYQQKVQNENTYLYNVVSQSGPGFPLNHPHTTCLTTCPHLAHQSHLFFAVAINHPASFKPTPPHSTPCQIVVRSMQSFPVIFPGLISWLRSFLSRTCSPRPCRSNPIRPLTLDFASAPSLTPCSLPGFPLRRLLSSSVLAVCSPSDRCLSGFCISKALNYTCFDLCHTWV